MKYENKNGLLVPKTPKEKLPRFSIRQFICYYESDVQKFKEIVEKTDAYWGGVLEIDFLNVENRNGIGTQYVCIYQYYENIEMEVLC
jgi:hypothetical protein